MDQVIGIMLVIIFIGLLALGKVSLPPLGHRKTVAPGSPKS
jgi:hypothetical protein